MFWIVCSDVESFCFVWGLKWIVEKIWRELANFLM
jgi:hypothetical protein